MDDSNFKEGDIVYISFGMDNLRSVNSLKGMIITKQKLNNSDSYLYTLKLNGQEGSILFTLNTLKSITKVPSE
ncbi:hypothetical protein [Abyssalbus ytuae]|uniref:Uncharacterized protein n=1 Tax=Abyssalbus ytuae TaxID=2926907 RepID=A0A9E7A1U8_9FLAO|nr:hypothetical protein [Abyssalbus ytuae]UOB18186.1 hypothetical protein MQE35_02540 [Abyssalbus ytuae]